MAEVTFADLLGKAEAGVTAAAVPEGTYPTVVTRAEAYDAKMIFITLTVLEGALSGKESDVSIYFPKDGDKRGVFAYFAKKSNGFASYADVKAAFIAADRAPDRQAALELIASTLLNKQVTAQVSFKSEGDRAGTNDLVETKAPQLADSVVITQADVAAVPAAVVEAAPAAPAPAATDGQAAVASVKAPF